MRVWVPHETLLRLAVPVVGGYSVSTSVLVTPPAVPVMVTLIALITAEDTTSNPVDFDPAATVTACGT